MKLFLASTVKHEQTLSDLENFVGGSFTDKSIAYIPTASNGEFFGKWKGGRSIQVAQELNPKSFDIVELESFSYQDIASKFLEVDIIWMAGGMAGYLLYWIRRSQFDKLLPKLLDQGKIYVGSSAGSMVMSQSIKASEWILGDLEPGAQLLPGLGYIDYEIYPHYEEKWDDEIKANWNSEAGEKLCLLKDGEAITVVDDEAKILGEERLI